MAKDYRVLPRIVLFEGINLSGKSHVIRQLREAYTSKIEVVKFPRDRFIIRQIEFLFREIKRQENRIQGIAPAYLDMYLRIIHQLFDLDFRQFCTSIEIRDLSKIYFLDRYYPSNIVYSKLHSLVPNPKWDRDHNMKPDITILMNVTDRNAYIRNFPVYDTEITLRTGNELQTTIQLLSPEYLFDMGQKFYLEFFFENSETFQNVYQIEALRDTTFREVERVLVKHEFL